MAVADSEAWRAAFSGYLGDDKSQWSQYDACELLSRYSGPQLPVLIDVGTGDNFYKVRSSARLPTRPVMLDWQQSLHQRRVKRCRGPSF